MLGADVFVGWQNGIGPKGEPSATGQTNSTVVEYSSTGAELASWSLPGKVDGMGADPERHRVIATVNEDGNSSLYTIRAQAPGNRQVEHYTYSPAPDSAASGGVFSGGGTDAVTVRDGRIYISASAPTAANATAVFAARLDRRYGVARLYPTFADNAATDAVTGQSVALGLTDPDSNASVPESSPRFAGQLMLNSQGDQQLVFARGLGWGGQGRGGDGQGRDGWGGAQLTRLNLTYGGMNAGADDVRWAAQDGGTLLVVDSHSNTVYAVTGPFRAGEALAGLDTVGTATNTTQVDSVDLNTGAMSPFLTGFGAVKGLMWISSGSGRGERLRSARRRSSRGRVR